MLIFIPFLAGVAGLFGVYYFFVGLKAVVEGGGFMSGIFVVHGLVGLSMCAVLWREHRKYRKQLREKSDE